MMRSLAKNNLLKNKPKPCEEDWIKAVPIGQVQLIQQLILFLIKDTG